MKAQETVPLDWQISSLRLLHTLMQDEPMRELRPVQDNPNLAVAVDGNNPNREGNISPARGRVYFVGTKEAR
ncbi:hypothetical protein CTI12_AA050040 [Artemisia annua]|uniref:Uncharacterized protein n=1 Tax=Artemisia annua TaxID=35608 RepID=A0A2U1QBR6_ARTAN|nr:hypothetical protein CTI12_AA050040 [Artemisia annua]